MPTSSPTTSPQPTRVPHRYESLEDLLQSPTCPPPSPHSNRRASNLFRTSLHSRHTSNADSIETARGNDRDLTRVEPRSTLDDDLDTRTKRSLTTFDMINLTLGLAGAQLTWTVEMAYGTPYLLELGISKQGTSLVWMAGPLSGLLIQPLVGALSDASTSRYRRRFYIALSATLIIISTLVVSFAKELASVFCSLGGIGDWDPERIGWEQTVAIWIGVSGFYVLDFSLNGLQAAMRALVLDIAPSRQQNEANAWLGRQTNVANILGYLCGFVELDKVPALSWFGGGQFRRLGVISCFVMAITVVVTCVTQKEEKRTINEQEEEDDEVEGGRGKRNSFVNLFLDIKDSVRDLPVEVKRVCIVQFFAWTAWFPFLFYSTTYVSETLYTSIPKDEPLPSSDDATRAGSLALLFYAITALIVGTFLPYLTSLGSNPTLMRRISFSTKLGRTLRWGLSLTTPRNCWTLGLWSYTVGTMGTFFVRGPKGAMIFVAGQGVSWAVTCWVPFALVMEYIRESSNPTSHSPSETSTSTPHDEGRTPRSGSPSMIPSSSSQSRQAPFFRSSNRQQSFITPYSPSSPASPRFPSSSFPRQSNPDERSPLLSSQPQGEEERQESNGKSHTNNGRGRKYNKVKAPLRGGTVLGIHNLSIVAPQFLVAIVSAIILKITSSSSSSSSRDDPSSSSLLHLFSPLVGGNGKGHDGESSLRTTNDVVWVLRFGGLAAIGGAIASRWILPPKSEREYVEKVLYGQGNQVVEREEFGEREDEEEEDYS